MRVKYSLNILKGDTINKLRLSFLYLLTNPPSGIQKPFEIVYSFMLQYEVRIMIPFPESMIRMISTETKYKNTEIYLLMQCKSSFYTTSKDRLSIHKNV